MQGIGDIFASPRMLEQRMASQGMAFGQQQHAIDPGSYGQQAPQMRGAFGQPSHRSSHVARYTLLKPRHQDSLVHECSSTVRM